MFGCDPTRLAIRVPADSRKSAAANEIMVKHSSRARAALRAVVKRFRRNPTGNGPDASVDRLAADLEELNHSTEGDFLAVGARLMDFRTTARQIESDMAALSELIAGERGHKVSRTLTRILEHTGELDTRIRQSGQTFEQVHGLSCRIRHAFGGLRNMVSAFRALCTLTRIETSRVGKEGNDFGDLAAEVAPLSESIQTSGEGVLEVASQLDREIQCAIRNA